MGKFTDALEKAGYVRKTRSSSEARPQERRSPQEEKTPGKAKDMVESLQLKPRFSNELSTQQNCKLPPMSELLVGCRHDGNREVKFAAEQYKMLRSQLLFPAEGQAPRTILVTSAIPGEGKSLVASNLAVSIALGKQEHVLLIECDLRKPSLCNIFGLTTCTGLSDYLQEEAELSNIFCKTAIDKLTLLPAGPSKENPHELMTSKRMMDLLTEVRNRYADRYVILDSPPVKVAAETSVLSGFVDSVVLVSAWGTAPRKLLLETVEKIGRERLLGVVFNGLDVKSLNSYYYNYYGDKSKYSGGTGKKILGFLQKLQK